MNVTNARRYIKEILSFNLNVKYAMIQYEVKKMSFISFTKISKKLFG